MPAARARLALVVALAAATTAAAADLGVLFHTPDDRARLDKLRRGEPTEAQGPGPVVAAKPEVTGFVRRSDGRSTVWINGVPVTVAGPRGEILLDPRAVRSPENVKIERGKGAEVKR